MQYGNAVERMVAQDIRQSPVNRMLFEHVSKPFQRGPDFVGRGPLQGMNFDITTVRGVADHLKRPYGSGLKVITYQRPPNFTVFP